MRHTGTEVQKGKTGAPSAGLNTQLQKVALAELVIYIQPVLKTARYST